MKLLEIAASTVKAVVAPITGAVKAAVRRGDPWYSDDERRFEVNAASLRARGGRWIARRPGWLSGRS